MELFYFCMALLIVLVTAVLVYRKRRLFNSAVRLMLVGITLVITVLIIPMYSSTYDPVTSGLFSILYALRALLGCQNVDTSHKVAIEGWLYYAYYAVLYFAFITAPIFTTGFLISLFGNVTDKIRFTLITGRELHVFSELNESSVLLAESISTEKVKFIFCNCMLSSNERDSELVSRARGVGSLFMDKSETDLKFNKRNKKIRFYQISSCKDYNINSAIELIEKYRNESDYNIKIDVFSTGVTSELLLDSMDKGFIAVKLIDEVKYTCYSLLDSAPLFEGMINNQISALVIGGGYTGLEMVKAISWCGLITNCSLKINVVDKCANSIKSEFKINCPEMFSDNYKINFINADVTKAEFADVLEQYCQDTTYVVIAMADDKMNIDTAVYLRKFFLQHDRKHFHNQPIINLRVRDPLKNRQIDALCDSNIQAYGFNAFGSSTKTFSVGNLMYSSLEKMAKGIHLAYANVLNGTKEEINKAMNEYYIKEYNQRSSFASAIHIKYKLYSCGIRGLNGNSINLQQIEEIERKLQDPAILEQLAKLEHERWNAFIRTEGYSLASIDDVYAYYNIGSRPSHVNYLAKLHPSLVDWDSLDTVSEKISEIKGTKIDFKQDDYDIVRRIPDILNAQYSIN